MDTLLNLLSLLGSLALFLYGMKIMSEGLEKFAGDRLRSILAMMTKNRLMGVLTGVLVTALIQSSSATTVMVVSFVNAGLMNLIEAIGVIMGANIGTTVTAWVISAVGFKVNIAAFAIPLLAIGMPLIFSSKNKRKSIGEFVFGFAFIFMGLNFLQTAANSLGVDTIVANMLANVEGDNFFVILLFVIVGAAMTILVQTSSATMAMTLMLFNMNIPGFGLAQACALAMGQNIGTTVTAFLASLTANTQARRAALAHMFFNVFGVVVVLVIFYPFINGVVWFVDNVMHAGNNPLFQLSAFHSAFNIFNTLLLIGFVRQIAFVVCKIMPMKESDKQDKGLRFITGGLLSTAELSIIEAKKEIGVFAERLNRMLDMVEKLIGVTKSEEFAEIFAKINKYEQITDNMEVEIANYLGKVSEGRLSDESKQDIIHMLRMVSELESIGDSMYHLGRTLDRKRELSPEPFSPAQQKNIVEMLRVTRKAMLGMTSALESDDPKTIDLKEHYETENELNILRSDFRAQNTQAVNNREYDYQLGTFYIDFISECEKVGDYVINVLQAYTGK